MAKMNVRINNPEDQATVEALINTTSEFTRILTELTISQTQTASGIKSLDNYFNGNDPNKSFKNDLKEFAQSIIQAQENAVNMLFWKICGVLTMVVIITTAVSNIVSTSAIKKETMYVMPAQNREQKYEEKRSAN